MDIAASLPFIASGFGVGFLVGMTGVGGGSLMTPVLILLFGVQTTTAVGTDLLYAAATKSAGTLTRGFSQAVDWKITARLACGSVPGTTLTSAVLYLLDVHGGASPRSLNVILGMMLLVSAAGMLLVRRLRWLTVRDHPSAFAAASRPGNRAGGLCTGCSGDAHLGWGRCARHDRAGHAVYRYADRSARRLRHRARRPADPRRLWALVARIGELDAGRAAPDRFGSRHRPRQPCQLANAGACWTLGCRRHLNRGGSADARSLTAARSNGWPAGKNPKESPVGAT